MHHVIGGRIVVVPKPSSAGMMHLGDLLLSSEQGLESPEKLSKGCSIRMGVSQGGTGLCCETMAAI